MQKISILCVIAALSFNQAIAGEEGKLKICRHKGLTEMMDSKAITIPAGSGFTNSGESVDFVITTTHAATLGHKPACAIADAKITDNRGHKVITKKSAGILEPQFSIPGASLQAKIISGF